MAASVNKPAQQQQQTPPEDDTTVGDMYGDPENPLAEYLQEGYDSTYGTGNETTEETETSTETPAGDDRITALAQQLEEINNRLQESEIRNTVLESFVRDGVSGQRQQPAPQPAQQQEDPGINIDMEALTHEMRTDTPRAVARLVQNVAEQTEARITERIRREMGAELQRNNEASNIQTADRQQTLAEYGPLFQDPTFAAAADAEYRKVTANGYIPNAMYLASSAAYARLARAGKLPQSQTQTTTPSKVTSLRERKNPPQRSLGQQLTNMGDSQTVPNNGDPDIDLTPKELAANRAMAKRLGISEAKVIARYKAERQKDRKYGQ